MLGIISEFEYHLKRERQLEGIAKAKAAGKYKGRKPLSDDIVTKVRVLKASGVSPTKIAKKLNMGRTTVYKYL
ncbi:MAG: helix-turn-helix domain-containing protein [Cytophagales bacterium]|nr:helix-turn-helix domain-containing protein [Cytophagales bacterium]